MTPAQESTKKLYQIYFNMANDTPTDDKIWDLFLIPHWYTMFLPTRQWTPVTKFRPQLSFKPTEMVLALGGWGNIITADDLRTKYHCSRKDSIEDMFTKVNFTGTPVCLVHLNKNGQPSKNFTEVCDMGEYNYKQVFATRDEANAYFLSKVDKMYSDLEQKVIDYHNKYAKQTNVGEKALWTKSSL